MALTPCETRPLLRLSNAAAAEGAPIAPAAGVEYCRARAANSLLRSDISAANQFFEVAHEGLDQLLHGGVYESSALDAAAKHYMERGSDNIVRNFRLDTTQLEQLFNRPAASSENLRPAYLSAAREFKARSQVRCLEVRTDTEHPVPTVLRDAVENGRNVLLLGPAGSGKSEFLASISKSGNLFEWKASQERGIHTKNHGYNRYSEKSHLEKTFRRFSDLKNLDEKSRPSAAVIDEATFLTPAMLAEMAIFKQLILVGDPCQLGAPLGPEFITDFMERTGALIHTTGVMYRTANPELFQLLNYIGYNSSFTPHKLDLESGIPPFEVIEDHGRHIIETAVNILSTGLLHCQSGQTVLFASQTLELLKLVLSLKKEDPDRRKIGEKFVVVALHDLQGRQADVIIFDPREIDKYVTDVLDATCLLVMLLGRARHTICFLARDHEAPRSVDNFGVFSAIFIGCVEYCAGNGD